MLRKTGCHPELAVVVTAYSADIAVADGSPVTSALVMSGETTPELLTQSAIQPDLVVGI